MGHLDKAHRDLSHTRQCGLLSVSRSSTYYKASPVRDQAVDLMNEIRELWEKYPFLRVSSDSFFALPARTTHQSKTG